MAHHRFAQRAWLPQQGGRGLVGPTFSTMEDSVCGRCPGPFSGPGGMERGTWQGECILPRAGVVGAARVREQCREE